MTDEDIILYIKNYFQSNTNIPKSKFFNFSNQLPSSKMLRDRFGSMKVIYEKCGFEVSNVHFSKFKNKTDKFLLEKLKWYNENIEFPTQRSVSKNDLMPSYNIYYKRFGSFKNAIILSEIEIPKDKERFFNREALTDDELIHLLKKYIQNNKMLSFLPNFKDIQNIKEIPSPTVYYRRFKDIEGIYEKLGYNYEEYNLKVKKELMKIKYMEIFEDLKRTPNSRDIEKYSHSNLEYYSMSSYENNFGSLYALQIECNLIPTILGKNITKEEMIDALYLFCKELGRSPSLQEIDDNEKMCSSAHYTRTFGDYHKLLESLDMEFKKSIVTKSGVKCLSYYELKITEWLEDNCVVFKKEVLYSKVIKGDNTKRRFDWMIEYDNNKYYIEMFGVTNIESYNKKTQQKIKDCKENNINLIEIYPKDIKNKTMNEIFYFLN